MNMLYLLVGQRFVSLFYPNPPHCVGSQAYEMFKSFEYMYCVTSNLILLGFHCNSTWHVVTGGSLLPRPVIFIISDLLPTKVRTYSVLVPVH